MTHSPNDPTLCQPTLKGRETLPLATGDGTIEGYALFNPATPTVVGTKVLASLLGLSIFAVIGFFHLGHL